MNDFHFRQNIGLHHVALQVATEIELHEIAHAVASYAGAKIEFMPELVGNGPRKHVIFAEPGGIRIEFIWSGS